MASRSDRRQNPKICTSEAEFLVLHLAAIHLPYDGTRPLEAASPAPPMSSFNELSHSWRKDKEI
jgi:hypothetical protein